MWQLLAMSSTAPCHYTCLPQIHCWHRSQQDLFRMQTRQHHFSAWNSPKTSLCNRESNLNSVLWPGRLPYWILLTSLPSLSSANFCCFPWIYQACSHLGSFPLAVPSAWGHIFTKCLHLIFSLQSKCDLFSEGFHKLSAKAASASQLLPATLPQSVLHNMRLDHCYLLFTCL